MQYAIIFRSGSSPVLHISNFPVPVRSVSNISGSVPVRFYFSNYAPVPVPVRFYISRFRFRSGSTFKNILRFRSGPFLTFPVPFRSGAKFQNRRRALIRIMPVLGKKNSQNLKKSREICTEFFAIFFSNQIMMQFRLFPLGISQG